MPGAGDVRAGRVSCAMPATPPGDHPLSRDSLRRFSAAVPSRVLARGLLSDVPGEDLEAHPAAQALLERQREAELDEVINDADLGGVADADGADELDSTCWPRQARCSAAKASGTSVWTRSSRKPGLATPPYTASPRPRIIWQPPTSRLCAAVPRTGRAADRRRLRLGTRDWATGSNERGALIQRVALVQGRAGKNRWKSTGRPVLRP